MREAYLGTRKIGTFLINSNTRVIITQNSEIVASDDIDDYFVDDTIFEDTCNNEFGRALFYARGKENIEICAGKNATINGRGTKWKDSEFSTKRPSIIRMVDCKNIKLSNLTLIDSPCWCIHLHNCENVEIEGLNIVSKWCLNNDGIDLDCCRNVRVNGCTIDTGDDGIAIKGTKNIETRNIIIENCQIQSDWSAFKIGTESVGNFQDITFRNNVIKKALGCAIKIVPTDGGSVKNVCIKDVVAENVTGPIFIANGERMRTYYPNEARDEFGSIQDITIENFKADVVTEGSLPVCQTNKGAVIVTGTQKNAIENVSITDCEFLMPGGVRENLDFFVEELGNGYPEYYVLGTVPACGAYFRHIRGLTVKNVKFGLKEADVRGEIVTDDVTLFEMELTV